MIEDPVVSKLPSPGAAWRARRCGTLLLAAAALLGSAGAPGDEIKIGGTGNALGTMRLLGDAFTRKYPQHKVNVLVSLGSSGAIKAVPQGAIDIGVASRALSNEEQANGIVSREYARTLTVLAVPATVKASAITRAQIADIYSGKLTHWPDGSAIRPVLRQAGDDNTKQISSLSPAIGAALAAAEQRPGQIFAASDQEAADKLETIVGAVGVSTLALIVSERRALTALSLDGSEPTVKNGASGAYPLVKRFFFITKDKPSASASEFIAFVGSPAGHAILAQTGHWLPSAQSNDAIRNDPLTIR